MELDQYQQQAAMTIQSHRENPDMEEVIPFLGIIGEAGSIISELKKKIRDGKSYTIYNEKLKEELGDALWYVAAIATQYKLSLEDIAKINLAKVADRFNDAGTETFRTYDENYPEQEQFPREIEICFESFEEDARKKIRIIRMDTREPIGDILTDNAHREDGYRFHDIFHYGYVAYLGWSPVLRHLLKNKRKSEPCIDEAEDGARARIIEELVALYVYSNAQNHQLFKYSEKVDSEILKTIKQLTKEIEVRDCSAKQWETAILGSYKVLHELIKNDGGRVLVSIKNKRLTYLGKH